MRLWIGSNPPRENVVSKLNRFEPRGEEIWLEYEDYVEHFEIESNGGLKKQIAHPARPARFRSTREMDSKERKARAIGVVTR